MWYQNSIVRQMIYSKSTRLTAAYMSIITQWQIELIVSLCFSLATVERICFNNYVPFRLKDRIQLPLNDSIYD